MMHEYGLVASGERCVDEDLKSSANLISDLIIESFYSLSLTIFILFNHQRIIGKLIE